ncbi:hypothetical protein M011DRAFT_224720 [Sporormia fimetaria CBS 119925]|uniref:Uncharacterized protein n=1 Tax=Sporormia fimetaria CBS 119925 TaxID=1340428 RepID=A0A6A6V298_9PLEO|nr:hypothetical protein M011DRAFT_224720 [Sporormia fimetaria CBS 119925]
MSIPVKPPSNANVCVMGIMRTWEASICKIPLLQAPFIDLRFQQLLTELFLNTIYPIVFFENASLWKTRKDMNMLWHPRSNPVTPIYKVPRREHKRDGKRSKEIYKKNTGLDSEKKPGPNPMPEQVFLNSKRRYTRDTSRHYEPTPNELHTDTNSLGLAAHLLNTGRSHLHHTDLQCGQVTSFCLGNRRAHTRIHSSCKSMPHCMRHHVVAPSSNGSMHILHFSASSRRDT